MAGTITYNFDPEQTVYVITNCDRISGQSRNPNILISNSQFGNSSPVQQFPVTGDIIIREGVVKEVMTSIVRGRQNTKSRMVVSVVGGQVVSTGTTARLDVDVVGGVVTSVNVVNGGSLYQDGTFTLLLTSTAGGGDGLAEISYNVINGSVVSAVVNAGGSTYNDGTGIIITEFPAPLGVRMNNGGKGYFPDSTKAQFTVDVVGGVVVDADLINNGYQYPNGTFSFNLNTTAGGGDGLAEVTFTVVDDEVTSVAASVGGSTYTNGIGQAVNPVDVTDPINQFDLLTTAGKTGTTNVATIGYTVANGQIVDPFILNSGNGYTDDSFATVLDVPSPSLEDFELVYRILLTNTPRSINIEAEIDGFGVEQNSDIFDNLPDAATAYEARISS